MYVMLKIHYNFNVCRCVYRAFVSLSSKSQRRYKPHLPSNHETDEINGKYNALLFLNRKTSTRALCPSESIMFEMLSIRCVEMCGAVKGVLMLLYCVSMSPPRSLIDGNAELLNLRSASRHRRSMKTHILSSLQAIK